MAEKPKAAQPMSTRGRVIFWVGALVVAVGLVALIVVLISQGSDDIAQRKADLNDRYVEQIDIRKVPSGGGSYSDLIVIDGTSRYDCSEEDGRLSCSDDPQPTEQ